MPRGALFGQRKAAVAVIFAISALPIIGLIGLAVDFGVWNQSNAALSVAANVAALTAVKVAANAQLAGDQNATTEGQVAGQQWFLAEIGNVNSIGTTHVTGLSGATVKVTGGATLTATVSYQGNVPSIFGNIFAHIGSYPINGQAVAVVSSSPYLNIEILLDNSGSMEIGATNDDIIAMQKYTPCSYGAPVLTGAQPNAPGAFYLNADGKNYSQLAGQSYNAYATAGYTGSIPTPAAADPKLNLTGNAYPVTGALQGPSCQGVLPKSADGTYPLAGPPCAFACHFDNGPGRPAAGAGNDYYAIARRFAGTSKQINLRFDLVKQATRDVISAMQGDNIPTLNNLQVGVFTFDVGLNRVYPEPGCGNTPACEANNDWTTAINDVGYPPSAPYGPDTGIQPSTAGNGNGNSDFHDTMTTLSTTLTASGDGTSATSPRKVLFLISDGYNDNTVGGGRTQGPVNAADCSLFKQMGYTIYVVYTPYYPVMNGYYIGTVKPKVEPTTNGPLAQALQACSSDPTNDYVSASDQNALSAALQKFLKSALTQPARFSM